MRTLFLLMVISMNIPMSFSQNRFTSEFKKADRAFSTTIDSLNFCELQDYVYSDLNASIKANVTKQTLLSIYLNAYIDGFVGKSDTINLKELRENLEFQSKCIDFNIWFFNNAHSSF